MNGIQKGMSDTQENENQPSARTLTIAVECRASASDTGLSPHRNHTTSSDFEFCAAAAVFSPLLRAVLKSRFPSLGSFSKLWQFFRVRKSGAQRQRSNISRSGCNNP